MLYIMRAFHLTSSGRKLNLARILQDHPTCTILDVTSETSRGPIDRFVISAGSGEGYEAGQGTRSTIDTGRGHRDCGDLMTINRVFVFEGGVLKQKIKGMFDWDISRGIPKTLPAYTFVMK